ncbi:MAG: hypothetical protein IPQ03_11480 [Bacteroidetes bacterium]|nr:hypothetical protein [Bacteroidota bacterium]
MSGQLLFYTNGVSVVNRYNLLMLNGDSLNPSDYTDTWRNDGLKIQQGDLILPALYDSAVYYLFHETVYTMEISFGNYIYQPTELYYTKVDMRLDSGKGAVVFKNIPIISDTLLYGGVTACKHANGRDWWIICHRYNSDIWYTLLLTPYGINGPYIQHAGQFIPSGGGGQSVFSADGTKFIRHQINNNLDIFDFDRCNGLLSNYNHIAFFDSSGAVGAAISPNSRYLYISENPHVYQLDLQAPNVLNSLDTIATLDGFYDPSPPFYTSFYLSHLANDGKIYIITGNGTQWLHVINHPDSAGMACDLQQHSFKLPTVNGTTIPNYPNFFLGAQGGTVCDSLITSNSNVSARRSNSLLVFPNPCHGLVYAQIPEDLMEAKLEIRNSIGQLISAPEIFIKMVNTIRWTCQFFHQVYLFLWFKPIRKGLSNASLKINSNNLSRSILKYLIIENSNSS